MIERQHLAILRETDRLGSVTAAADVLHLTQSALSHAIRRLEAQAGVALWEKEGRRLRPTQAGRHLIALAARVLPQLEQAEATLADFARGRKGLLRIGMECHPCYRWLLRVVEPYLRDWPQVDVDVRQAFQFGGLKHLEHFQRFDKPLRPFAGQMHLQGVSALFDRAQVQAQGGQHLRRRTDRG